MLQKLGFDTEFDDDFDEDFGEDFESGFEDTAATKNTDDWEGEEAAPSLRMSSL